MDGILIINKPKSVTSNNVVNKVKHILNCKVGHTGTLDPNATGVLPLLLGSGTKFSKYLINHDKKYCATLKLGEKTSTADVEGEVIEQKTVGTYNIEYIKEVLESFIGKQEQIPPVYSAIKVNGKKLYDYARKGIEVQIPSRQIEIYSIELINYNKEDNTIIYCVECSKGTYIRTLCECIASKLDTVGYMKDLERVKVGDFDLGNAVSIEELEENQNNKEWLNANIVTLEQLLNDKLKICIKKTDFNRYINGVNLKVNCTDDVYKIYCDDKFLGSGIVKNGMLKRDVVVS